MFLSDCIFVPKTDLVPSDTFSVQNRLFFRLQKLKKTRKIDKKVSILQAEQVKSQCKKKSILLKKLSSAPKWRTLLFFFKIRTNPELVNVMEIDTLKVVTIKFEKVQRPCFFTFCDKIHLRVFDVFVQSTLQFDQCLGFFFLSRFLCFQSIPGINFVHNLWFYKDWLQYCKQKFMIVLFFDGLVIPVDVMRIPLLPAEDTFMVILLLSTHVRFVRSSRWTP